jgi:hypothetical protein
MTHRVINDDLIFATRSVTKNYLKTITFIFTASVYVVSLWKISVVYIFDITYTF